MGEAVSTGSTAFLVALHQNLIDCFGWAEIEELCFLLSVEYEIAPGTIKSELVWVLLKEVGRAGRL